VNFLHELMKKPWLEESGTVVELQASGAFALPTATLALRVFLAVVTVLFSLLVVAYADRLTAGDWRPLPEPWVLWLNTVALVLGSVGLQRSLTAANRGRLDGVKIGLLAGGGFAIVFLAGQLVAWQQLVALGYYAATNPANAFFFVMTALHGLHLFGGLVALGRTADKVLRGFDVDQVRLSVELCAVYWHFLLAVWLILFGLMLFT
jgi:cytochrome c oxidase subunit 3